MRDELEVYGPQQSRKFYNVRKNDKGIPSV